MEFIVGVGFLFVVNLCCFCFRVGVILKKGLKEGDMVLVDSEKVVVYLC